jgi:CheY-like chemotaxis protein
VGTGLGLSTVYGTVRQHLGFVTVSSEPDQGTTFEIYLPRRLGEVAPEWTRTGTTPARGWETILIVEDEVGILKLAAKALTAAGYTVLAASSPEEGLQVAAGHAGDIHLLLTDVVMPGMNGQEVANTLRAGRPTIRRLFMSGYPAEVMSKDGALPEGVAFIQKPFRVADLRAKVRELLDAD